VPGLTSVICFGKLTVLRDDKAGVRIYEVYIDGSEGQLLQLPLTTYTSRLPVSVSLVGESAALCCATRKQRQQEDCDANEVRSV